MQESNRRMQQDSREGRNIAEAQLPPGEQTTTEGQLQRETSEACKTGKEGAKTA